MADTTKPTRPIQPNRSQKPAAQPFSPTAIQKAEAQPVRPSIPVAVEQPAPAKPVKMPFIQWFNDALTRYPKLKPVHMHAVKAYFRSKGLKDPNTFANYEAMLKVYGI